MATGNLLFVSGQTPKDPENGTMARDIQGQAARCLENVKAIVEEAGATLSDVVKTNAYLKDIRDFSAFNAVYSLFFSEPYPARTTIQAVLPGDQLLVEIDVVVAMPSPKAK
jgi:2-iminobutanoate/2-iminopropanoate deaminase